VGKGGNIGNQWFPSSEGAQAWGEKVPPLRPLLAKRNPKQKMRPQRRAHKREPLIAQKNMAVGVTDAESVWSSSGEEETGQELMFKIIVIGDAGVGASFCFF
jgi:hypothetical protein